MPLYPAQHARLPMGTAPRPPPNPPFRSSAQGFPGGHAAKGFHASMAGFQGRWPVGNLGARAGGHQGITSAVQSGIVRPVAHQQQQLSRAAGPPGQVLHTCTGLPDSSVPPPPPPGHTWTPVGPTSSAMSSSSMQMVPVPHNAKVRHDRLPRFSKLAHASGTRLLMQIQGHLSKDS